MGYRIITIRPESLADLRAMVVSDLRGVMLLLTKSEVQQHEQVLLDVRLPEMSDSWLLRARASFTLPEGRGPFFAVMRDNLPRFHHLLAGGRSPVARVASRYPVSLDARITLKDGRSVYAQVTDLSTGGARVSMFGQLTVGGEVSIELSQPSCGLPNRLTAEVRVDRAGTYGVCFASDDDGRRAVRRFIRHAEAIGQLPHLD